MTLYCKQLTHYTQPSTIPLPSRLSSVPPPSPHRGWPGPADPHCKILTMLIPDDSSRVPDTDTSFFFPSAWMPKLPVFVHSAATEPRRTRRSPHHNTRNQ